MSSNSSSLKISVVVLCFFLPLMAGAASLPNLLKWDNVNDLVNGIIDVFIKITLPLIVFFIVYAGFKYLTAQGDPKKISSAHQILLWTVIGAAVMFGAKAIILAIQQIVKGL